MDALERTPVQISAAITVFCANIAPGAQPPEFLDVTPAPSANTLDCFRAVDRVVRKHGGAPRFGWRITEWPLVMLRAEFHAVWQDPDGKTLRDITPTETGEARTLFLLDPNRRYEGRQVSNAYFPLRQDPMIDDYIGTCNAEFEFMNRGTRATRHRNELHSYVEKLEWDEIVANKNASLSRLIASLDPVLVQILNQSVVATLEQPVSTSEQRTDEKRKARNKRKKERQKQFTKH